MAESFVNVTEGSGKKLHTNTRTIGSDTVHDEVTVAGEPYLASAFAYFDAVGCATNDDHTIQLMAGANNKLRIRRIWIQQREGPSASGRLVFQVLRLTTAGTGGSAGTITVADPSDSVGATSRVGITASKGTEGAILFPMVLPIAQNDPNNVPPVARWEQHPYSKPIIVSAGTANGIALKMDLGANATVTVSGFIEFTESSF